MFTVLGMIGMTAIIINDSIVLVTTIDEYSVERGLIPAIIDGTADRLRPVLLTTATTVLGLAPLLYEGSADAQFLKPTVITLCYGLGFGMVLVLLVVPALLTVQSDVTRMVVALRRALGALRRAPVIGSATWVALAGMAALFAATLGSWLVEGRMVAPLAALLPDEGAATVLGVFLAGTLVWVLAVYVVSAILIGANRRPA